MTDIDLNGNPGTFGKYPSPHTTGACGIDEAHSDEDHDAPWPSAADPETAYLAENGQRCPVTGEVALYGPACGACGGKHGVVMDATPE